MFMQKIGIRLLMFNVGYNNKKSFGLFWLISKKQSKHFPLWYIYKGSADIIFKWIKIQDNLNIQPILSYYKDYLYKVQLTTQIYLD